jgi:ABC-type molybdate transport system permease subunit
MAITMLPIILAVVVVGLILLVIFSFAGKKD